MPRIRQNQEKYSNADFLKEIAHRKIEAGISSDHELSKALKMSPAAFSRRKNDPGMISVGELRKLVQVLSPDPVELLRFLGYSGKAIKAFQEGQA